MILYTREKGEELFRTGGVGWLKSLSEHIAHIADGFYIIA